MVVSKMNLTTKVPDYITEKIPCEPRFKEFSKCKVLWFFIPFNISWFFRWGPWLPSNELPTLEVFVQFKSSIDYNCKCLTFSPLTETKWKNTRFILWPVSVEIALYLTQRKWNCVTYSQFCNILRNLKYVIHFKWWRITITEIFLSLISKKREHGDVTKSVVFFGTWSLTFFEIFAWWDTWTW